MARSCEDLCSASLSKSRSGHGFRSLVCVCVRVSTRWHVVGTYMNVSHEAWPPALLVVAVAQLSNGVLWLLQTKRAAVRLRLLARAGPLSLSGHLGPHVAPLPAPTHVAGGGDSW